MDSATSDIKYLIKESTIPLIFKKIINWDLINWSLDDWKNILKYEIMEFRVGSFKHTNKPQWERTTERINETFEYFLEHVKSDTCDKWLYFDYKHLCNNFTDCETLRDAIKWEDIGLSEIEVDQCTIWIGSKGAHTPCHMDTYGCNMITQVYGRKLWIIFSPETNLLPTRVPYEESSVYSKLNFFSPTLEDFKGVGGCRMVVLEPGDVLFLPHGWWHYVENLETAISINTWIPLEIDHEERLKESVVQFIVKQMTGMSDKQDCKIILNPNMEEIIDDKTDNLLQTIINMRKICLAKQPTKRIKSTHSNTQTLKQNTEELSNKNEDSHEVPILTHENFQLFLMQQLERFTDQSKEVATNKTNESSVQDIVEAFTDIEVISLIKDKLLSAKNKGFMNQ